MVRSFPWLVLAFPVLLLSAGCDASSSSPDSFAGATDGAASLAANEEAAAVSDEQVELVILSFDEIQELIADKRGKVVVIDAWSTGCPPCLKDFHNLVELHDEYPPEDLACISLSFDYEGGAGTSPEDVREPVMQFLESQGATFDNVVSSDESDVLYRKFDLNSVPAIFVYGRDGELRKRFESEGAYEAVRPLVAELVKEPAPTDGAADEEASGQ